MKPCLMRGIVRSAIFALALFTLPALAAEPIIGVASVVDGDTIEIHGQRIRLHGIDAPESRQTCIDAKGESYRCGQKAAFALDDFLKARQPTTCIEDSRDRYRRIVARCTAGGQDVAAWLVENGHALDWPQYSRGEYASGQQAAQGARFGMWAGSFARPWEWRRDRKAAPLIDAGSI